jgi:integrase/recombinase XerD
VADLILLRDADPAADNLRLAVAGFLARYREPTLSGYIHDLRCYFAWCESVGLPVLEAKRPHIEVFARSLEARYAMSTVKKRLSTVVGLYRFAAIDGYIDRSPAEHVRRPSLDNESTTLGLDRMELGGFLATAAAGPPTEHALACLLGLLGLRVSEACGIDVDHLAVERGHRTVRVLGKGHKSAIIPMPPRIFRAVDLAVGERTEGPLLLGKDGQRLDRFAALRIVKRLAKRAGMAGGA